jgi:hypothetical protein
MNYIINKTILSRIKKNKGKPNETTTLIRLTKIKKNLKSSSKLFLKKERILETIPKLKKNEQINKTSVHFTIQSPSG